MQRRGFLRGRIPTNGVPLRPPWALAEAEFIERCTRCDACITACPTAILVRGDGGFPHVDFTRGECTFCAECVSRCEVHALLRPADATPPWPLRVFIGDTCLALHNVECRVCGESCAHAAIRFRPRAGGVARPALELDACTGCGACVAPCPTRAIEVRVPAPASLEIHP